MERTIKATLVTVLSLIMLPLAVSGEGLSPVKNVEYVVLIDNTGTMTRGGRGEATVSALKELIAGLEKGDAITVYSYGEKAHSVLSQYPARMNEDSARRLTSDGISFTFDADRTDMTAGMDLAWRERERVFPKTLGKGGLASRGVVVLLTDGKLIPVYKDYARYDEVYNESRNRLRRLASLFGEEGIRVFTIGLGTEKKVDGELLSELARRGGGEYYHSPRASDLKGVFEKLVPDIRGKEPKRTTSLPVVVEASAATPEAGASGAPESPARADEGKDEEKASGEEPEAEESAGAPGDGIPPHVVDAERALLCDYVFLLDDGRSVRSAGFSGAVIDASRMIVDLAAAGDFVSAYACGKECRSLLGEAPAELGDEPSRGDVRDRLSMRFREGSSDIAAALERVWSEREQMFPSSVRAQSGDGAVFILTDGTETAGTAEAQASDRRRLLDAASELASVGIEVHALALGGVSESQASLLREASYVSGGTYAKVPRASGLADALLEAVASAGGFVPYSQDPVDAFVVDEAVSSIKIASAGGSKRLSIIGPGGTELTARSRSANWSSGEGYTVVTVNSPEPGHWRLSSPARVAIDSDLVPVAQIPAHWHQSGRNIVVRAWVEQEPGSYRSRDSSLSVEAVYATEEAWDVEDWRTRVSLRDDGRGFDSYQGDGIYSGEVFVHEPGTYRVSVTVSGVRGEHAFRRVAGTREIRVLPPWFVFSPPGEGEFSARTRPQLRLSAARTGLCPALEDVSVTATIVAPDGSASGYGLAQADGSDRREAEISGFAVPGRYSATYHVEGTTPDGVRVHVQSETYTHDLIRQEGFFPSRLYQASTGVLALLLGVVAVGMGRKQSWAQFFTRPLWKEEQRVRGYLKPFYAAGGVRTARPPIGLENTGLAAVSIGAGTEFAAFARHTVIEVVGTTDGTPPTLHVERGSVKVGGEELTEPLALRDGDVIEIEGVAYTYLRGSRE